MTGHYAAKYTKVESGYMGQLLEWPEVVTERKGISRSAHALRAPFFLRQMVANPVCPVLHPRCTLPQATYPLLTHTSSTRSRKVGWLHHSYRNASTGLSEAALTASMPTVSIATTRTKRPAARKTQMSMVI